MIKVSEPKKEPRRLHRPEDFMGAPDYVPSKFTVLECFMILLVIILLIICVITAIQYSHIGEKY